MYVPFTREVIKLQSLIRGFLCRMLRRPQHNYASLRKRVSHQLIVKERVWKGVIYLEEDTLTYSKEVAEEIELFEAGVEELTIAERAYYKRLMTLCKETRVQDLIQNCL